MVEIKGLKQRVYECTGCGQKIVTTTNHEEECYPQCRGSCRQIINPNTSREVVLRKQTAHRYVEDWDETKLP